MIKPRVKLRDIADYTGNSISTVSAALNGTGRISPEKARQIKQAADELGFKPNLAAQLLKNSEVDILGLVISDDLAKLTGHGVYSELQENFISECRAENIRTQFELNRSGGVPAMFSDGIAKGVIHAGIIHPALLDWLKNHPDYPFVAIEEPWQYCVRTDFISGVYKAVQYLAATGHRSIALFCGPPEYDITIQILEGFKRGCRDFGLEFNPQLLHHHGRAIKLVHNEECAAFVHKVFSGKNRPDAIISTGQGFSSVALYELPRMGFRVPEDVSLIGSCASWEAERLHPGLSSIERNTNQLTTAAIKILKQLTRGIEPEISRLLIPAEMVARKTTAPRF